MKNLVFIIIILFSHASYAEIVTGSMTCIIKSQKITQIKDGQANEYTGYKNDNLQVGASLKLEYGYYKNDNEIFFKMSNKNRTFIYSVGKLAQRKTKFRNGVIYLTLKEHGFTSKIRLTKNFIIFRDIDMFNRYYKDDWMGITTTTTRSDNSVDNETVSWDCKHSEKSTLSDLYDSFKKHLGTSN